MKKPIYWILISVFSLIFVVSGIIVARYFIESHESKELQGSLIDLKTTSSTLPSSSSTQSTSPSTQPTGSTGETTKPSMPTTAPTIPQPTEPQILEEYQTLYEMNNHMVGWIYIPGSENPNQNNHGVNYPVLQTPNEPAWHNYYLYRNFEGEDDNHGWIYIREACDVFKPSDNVVIYGHNMADGTMFGQVVNYRHKSYYEEHKYIQFDTLYERHTYEIIAVFLTSGTSGVGYTYHSRNNFNSEEDFNEFINAIKGGDPRVKVYYDVLL